MDPTNRSTTGTEIDARTYSQRDRLLDGRPVLVRAIRPEDKAMLREGFRRLSPQSVYLRFFQAKKELSEAELRYLTEVDFQSHVALLVILDEEGPELGIGRTIHRRAGYAVGGSGLHRRRDPPRSRGRNSSPQTPRSDRAQPWPRRIPRLRACGEPRDARRVRERGVSPGAAPRGKRDRGDSGA